MFLESICLFCIVNSCSNQLLLVLKISRLACSVLSEYCSLTTFWIMNCIKSFAYQFILCSFKLVPEEDNWILIIASAYYYYYYWAVFCRNFHCWSYVFILIPFIQLWWICWYIYFYLSHDTLYDRVILCISHIHLQRKGRIKIDFGEYDGNTEIVVVANAKIIFFFCK